MNKQSLVWYASYGSNMDADRFSCYIAGGIPKGATRNYVGCDDKSLPIDDSEIELPKRLYFAGESKLWTGGVAFLGHKTSNDTTKARAYLIAASQFEQVVTQENWRDETLPIDFDRLKTLGQMTLGDGSGEYDELIYCGEHNGYPVVSFTSPNKRRPFTKPSPAYLRMISNGLQESHGLNTDEVVDYFIKKPGISGNYSIEELATIISFYPKPTAPTG